jgi:DNA-binding MarR family transcriptional regulator
MGRRRTSADVVSSSASQVYLRRFGVGVNDWRVISHLGMDPGCTAQVVSNELRVDKSVVSRSVRTLVDEGLVAAERTPGFRRLYLTAKGAALHKEMLPVAVERERTLLAGLSAEEVDQLLGLLRKLLGNLPALAAYDPAGTGADTGAGTDEDTGAGTDEDTGAAAPLLG